ncbi:MAG: transporter substrate-binding domain-containing protein [Pseudomonadota bacterium]|nr:transporter substrate-binding domain-containing protein [Pseudomonadota bacterium]
MRTVRIAYADPFRPFAWCENGVHRGRFLDCLGALAAGANVALRLVPGPMQDLPLWLGRGEIDAIAPQAIVPQRAGRFVFSRPLMETSAALFGPRGSVPPLVGEAGTARIATPVSGPLAEMLPALAPNCLVVGTSDYEDSLRAVANGIADWAALNADAGAELAAEWRSGAIGARGAPFARIGLAVAVRPGDPNGVLAALGL